MEFKRPISAGVGPYMSLFPDIYGFEGLPTFPAEIATFINGTLTICPKSSRNGKTIMAVIVDTTVFVQTNVFITYIKIESLVGF